MKKNCFLVTGERIPAQQKSSGGQPYNSAIPGKEERRASGTPLHVSAAPAASCREGAKRPVDSNKSQMTFCQNIKTALARTA